DRLLGQLVERRDAIALEDGVQPFRLDGRLNGRGNDGGVEKRDCGHADTLNTRYDSLSVMVTFLGKDLMKRRNLPSPAAWCKPRRFEVPTDSSPPCPSQTS